MNPMLQCKQTILPLFIAGVLACFGLLPKALAVVPPPPGGYPNFTTAAGDHALQALTLGVGNTAVGTFSLFSVTTGSFNTAVGAGALDLNTADSNTATGAAALLLNTTGFQNTAIGADALSSNIMGVANVAIGFGAEHFDDGFFNTVVGYSSGQNLTAGFENIYVGDTIGHFSPAGINEVNTMRIGDLTGFNGITQTFVGGIANSPQVWNGVTVCQVTVDFFGHLGVDCVNPNNPNAAPASPQRQGMLNDKVEKLQATVTQQQKQIEALTARLGEQAAQIQKVSAQLEMNHRPPQMVVNNH